MYSALSILNTTTEVPLNKAPNPQLLPGHRSINGCPLLRVRVHCCVCVHLGWDNCRAQIPSMGHHSWSYVTSLSHLLQHPGQRPPLKPLLHQFGGNVILLFDQHSSQSPPVLHQWPKKRKTFEKRKHLIKLSIFR